MAWYVESLILDRERIKQHFTDGFIVEAGDDDDPTALRVINKAGNAVESHVKVYVESDLNNPLFNDLLLVEKAISALLERGELDPIDLEVLQTLSEGGSLVELAQRYKEDVNMMIKYFFTSCNKISYELQGHFTDAGYIKYMSEKYKLTDREVKKMVRYMQKSRRTRIRRLINDKATY